jgi:hypothetical protein
MGVAGDRVEGESRGWLLSTGGWPPERQADITARGLDAAGAVTSQHCVEADVAAGGVNIETLGLDRSDIDVTAGGLHGEATARALDGKVAARGLKHEIPAGAHHPDVTRHGIERNLTRDALDPGITGGGVDPDPAGDRLGNFDGDVGPCMTANGDTGLSRLGRRPGSAAPERPLDLSDDSIDLSDDSIDIDVSRDAGPSSSGTRVHADLDPVLVGVDHEIDLLVAEVAGKTGSGMADEHVDPLGGADANAAIGVVDFEHERLVEVNGDTIISPSFRISSVRHKSSSQRWWVPVQGARTAVAEPPTIPR